MQRTVVSVPDQAAGHSVPERSVTTPEASVFGSVQPTQTSTAPRARAVPGWYFTQADPRGSTVRRRSVQAAMSACARSPGRHGATREQAEAACGTGDG